MHPRAEELIRSLGLVAHPEGGHYREMFRSSSRVEDISRGVERTAVTHIWFLLCRGEVSRWHRVIADELWHFYEGAVLELHILDPLLQSSQLSRLGPVSEGSVPFHAIPRCRWQAARTTGDYTLAGCTVSPGFSFDDFEMLASSSERNRLGNAPGLADFL